MFRARRIVFNLATFLPGVTALPYVRRALQRRATGTGGTISARYCYSIWLRHLSLAAKSGLNTNAGVIAELGPGDSLGIGLAALLTGAKRYLALDVVAHASAERNLAVFDELVELFRGRCNIPDNNEFQAANPTLDCYDFPHDTLTGARLEQALNPQRLAMIRESLRNCTSPESMIQYRAPWFGEHVVERDSIDMILSQAVLEHVDQLAEVYRMMRLWLAPAGFMSHQIDLKSHGWAEQWSGHWAYSDLAWKLIRGKDVWMINREPASTHLGLISAAGFRVVGEIRVVAPLATQRRQLSSRFRSLTDQDLVSSGLFVQAVPA
jgi:hypothetical protein